MAALLASLWLFGLCSGVILPRAELACQTNGDNGPLQITLDCIDVTYNAPIIDSETDETSPAPHHRVSGHFNGTTIEFNIYLPPKSQWEGRFFQLVYPSQSSMAENHTVLFGIESGGYTVQTSGTTGYRADAAVAKFSRKFAQEYYNDTLRSIYGYVYGGSGGSLQTIGAIENTFGVWDGAVALIQAVPMSLLNNWSIRSLPGLLLTDKKGQMENAASPIGRGDFSFLTETERSVLEESISLGVPIMGFEDYSGLGQNRTLMWDTLINIVIPAVKGMDPTYVDDFWSKPGYIGADQSELGDFFRNALVSFNSTIERVTTNSTGAPVEVVLSPVPANTRETGLEFAIVAGNGSTTSFSGRLNVDARTIYLGATNGAAALAALVSGGTVHVDNRWFLSVHSFYRHQVPPPEDGYYGYDYLRHENGTARYPQRNTVLASRMAKTPAGGGSHTGNITTKLIVMDNLLDYDAFPWHADWYKHQVEKALGDNFNNSYRLYYHENADHSFSEVAAPMTRRLVDFRGFVLQHLRDLSAWVERGVTPPKPTKYEVDENNQVVVPATAAERLGIQPVVNLTVEGSTQFKGVVGQSVRFKLHTEIPPNAGGIVSIEWDAYGTGAFVKKEFGSPSISAELEFTHTFNVSGTYIPGIRVTSHRESNTETTLALVPNLGRRSDVHETPPKSATPQHINLQSAD